MSDVEAVTLGELHRAVVRIEGDVREVRASSSSTATAAAVVSDKVGRLEGIVYGALGTAVAALGTAVVSAWQKGT